MFEPTNRIDHEQQEEIDRVNADVKKLDPANKRKVYMLALKYYIRDNDPWHFAKSYALALIKNWK